MNKYKPYKLHPYPWKADHGQIREANGYVIGNYPFTLGDETDHSSGRLMAKAPELIELMGLTLRTIGDVIRSEPNIGESNREVLDEISDMLREAIYEIPDQEGGEVKGIRFYLEYPNQTEKNKATRESLGNHTGNVIAVLEGTEFIGRFGPVIECLSAVFYQENSPVAGGAVSLDYLTERAKRISEDKAREIHPKLFERLDHG